MPEEHEHTCAAIPDGWYIRRNRNGFNWWYIHSDWLWDFERDHRQTVIIYVCPWCGQVLDPIRLAAPITGAAARR